VTNIPALSTINRSAGATVTWTGGEGSTTLTISGGQSSFNPQTQTISGAAFTCIVNTSAGQFTIPSSILTQISASPVISAGGFNLITRGSLLVTAVGKGARLTSPLGVDIFTVNNSWLWSFSTIYQ